MRQKRKSDAELRANFEMIIEKCGGVPLYSEFEKHTKISMPTYATRLGLTGKIYDRIVQYYVSEQDYQTYKERQQAHKSNVGKRTGKMAEKYSDEFAIMNLQTLFFVYRHAYGVTISRRLFDNISVIDSSQYRRRFNRSWRDVCMMAGVEVNKDFSSEAICIQKVGEILSETPDRWETWDWLIGNGGKHMYCDAYYKSANVVVEFDGAQHRVPIEKYGGKPAYDRLVANDVLKDKLLREHGIQVIRIDSRLQWYDTEWLTKFVLESINMG